MELESVLQFLKGKTFLVTGATGFVAKLFVEKILRIQPEVKRLYLLLRSPDSNLATERLHNEVIRKDLFRVLRDKWGADFGCFISEKLIAVAGDVSVDNLGVEDPSLKQEMFEEIDIVVHTAATTRFDERFDISMRTNIMGAFHVMNFTKSCRKRAILLHLSTAYVCGKAVGPIPEELIQMGQTGLSTLNIELEKELMEQKLTDLQLQNADEGTIKSEMENYGIQRANLYGWPNTYTFTKAMAEKILVNVKDDLLVIIIRPTTILSTCSDPFPGWIEGVRNVDSVIVGYAKGEITSFVADSNTILDIIPADMVVNSMIIALVVHSKNLSNKWIYHIGSSFRNPFKLSVLQDIMYFYFSKNPWVNEDGKQIAIEKKMAYLTSMAEFVNHMKNRHVVPKGLNLKDQVSSPSQRDVDTNSYGEIKRVMRMAELFKPFAFFKGIFEDKNAEELRITAKIIADMDSGFSFNSMDVNWMDYMMNAHIPGLVKYSNNGVTNLAKL